jgi:hypothetical protein
MKEALNDIGGLQRRSFRMPPNLCNIQAVFAERCSGRYASDVDPLLAKRWAAGHVAAGQRALEVMREEGPSSPDVSFGEAMDLIDLAQPTVDEFREQQVERARAAWAKLRAWAASRDRR